MEWRIGRGMEEMKSALFATLLSTIVIRTLNSLEMIVPSFGVLAIMHSTPVAS